MAQHDDKGPGPRGHHTPEHATVLHERVMTVGAAANQVKNGGTAKYKQLWGWVASHKKLTIPVAVVLVLAVLAAVPFTRYQVAGLVMSKDFAVTVIDSQTNKPVTAAKVVLDGKTATTNSKGTVSLHVKVGAGTLSISKVYYRPGATSVTVPIGSQKQAVLVRLVATGRQVPVVVLNKITGQPVENAVITAGKSEAKTDAKGEATIVVAADAKNLTGSVSLSGYNSAPIAIKVTASADPANTFSVTPSGKVYFLSNLSGKIDVVKTNLDGSARQTVLAGTGKEDTEDTVLLASRDWKYLVLKSTREDGKLDKLYLIETSSDTVTTIDEGDATFQPVGWSDDEFLYIVSRNGVPAWQPKQVSIKSYDAVNKRINVLDSTNATGSSNNDANYESLFAYSFVGDKFVYAKTWYHYPGYINVPGQQNTLNVVSPDGSGKKILKSLDSASSYFGSLALAKPSTLNVEVSSVFTAPESFYTYDGTALTTNTTLTDSTFFNNNETPTYLISPSDKQTFWSEARDGKNVLFVGDYNAASSKQVASLSDYKTYGWYTDNYLLVSKNSSELYIMPASGGTPLKITDYKPAENFNGYGGGYGGL